MLKEEHRTLKLYEQELVHGNAIRGVVSFADRGEQLLDYFQKNKSLLVRRDDSGIECHQANAILRCIWCLYQFHVSFSKNVRRTLASLAREMAICPNTTSLTISGVLCSVFDMLVTQIFGFRFEQSTTAGLGRFARRTLQHGLLQRWNLCCRTGHR